MGKYVIPETLSGEEIKIIRQSLNMTHKEFAAFCNCSIPAVKSSLKSKMQNRMRNNYSYQLKVTS